MYAWDFLNRFLLCMHDSAGLGKSKNEGIMKGASHMNNKKEPHEQMTEKNNNLSSAQEVHYQKDYNKADKAMENAMENKNETNDHKR